MRRERLRALHDQLLEAKPFFRTCAAHPSHLGELVDEVKAVLSVHDTEMAVLRAGVQAAEAREALHVRCTEREGAHRKQVLASSKRDCEAVAG